MMVTENLLVEIGTEELPPKALKSFAIAFADNFTKELSKAKLTFGKIDWYASPRRLALKVNDLLIKQPDIEVEKRGPAVKQGLDQDNKPTKALQGWLNSCGITLEQADKISTDKGEWFIYKELVSGKNVSEIIIELISNALHKLPISKPMHWGDKTELFIRPVHTATVLLGSELVDGEILGINTDRVINGHRFMGASKVTLENADQYPEKLKTEGMVIADFNERKNFIKEQAIKAGNLLGGKVDLEEELLDEVTSLVEFPVVLTAKFEEKFLKVPAEALVYTMKGDQKYFPVYNEDGNLLPNFIFVANIDPEDPTNIIQGNEKVVRPRLSDAEFFFKTDLKTKLEDLLPKLDNVLFQHQLGSLLDKTKRIETLSVIIAEQIGANITKAKRAALLSKCDLMTNMVFEFTDTQGIMGMHYAKHDGESEEVVLALKEQYLPKFAGDSLPTSLVSCSLSIADKIDTITGIIGIGQIPKADKDPFALRRTSLGVLRIMIEKNLKLDLNNLIQASIKLYDEKLTNRNTQDDVLSFILGRCPAYYQSKNYTTDVIQSVLSLKPTMPIDFDQRIKAVNSFKELPIAEVLAALNKRVSNILAKNTEVLNDNIELELAETTVEKSLIEKVEQLTIEIKGLIEERNYQQILLLLSGLSEDINNFFEHVMINVEDQKVRLNRLSLLNRIRNLFLSVADISLLQ